MSNIKKLFGTDAAVEKGGIILNYGELKIRIARSGGANKRYAKRLEQLSRPVRRAIETETLGREASDLLLYQVYAETVVLGWEGVKDDDGVEIPFTPEACMKFFQESPDFFSEIREQSDKAQLFRAIELDDDAKN